MQCELTPRSEPASDVPVLALKAAGLIVPDPSTPALESVPFIGPAATACDVVYMIAAGQQAQPM